MDLIRKLTYKPNILLQPYKEEDLSLIINSHDLILIDCCFLNVSGNLSDQIFLSKKLSKLDKLISELKNQESYHQWLTPTLLTTPKIQTLDLVKEEYSKFYQHLANALTHYQRQWQSFSKRSIGEKPIVYSPIFTLQGHRKSTRNARIRNKKISQQHQEIIDDYAIQQPESLSSLESIVSLSKQIIDNIIIYPYSTITPDFSSLNHYEGSGLTDKTLVAAALNFYHENPDKKIAILTRDIDLAFLLHYYISLQPNSSNQKLISQQVHIYKARNYPHLTANQMETYYGEHIVADINK